MDDDELLAALGEALQYERGVPPEFIALGKAAFAWYCIDAELAALTYDSVFEDAGAEVSGVRSDAASLRYLTFVSENLTLEIDVTDEALLGQFVPHGPGRVEIRAADGAVAVAVVDQVGGFAIRPVPRGSFRLFCQTANGANVLTDWLVLRDPPGA